MERLRKLEIPVLIVISLALVGTSGFFYKQNRDSEKQLQVLKSDPQKAAQLENRELVEKVGKLVVLPEGEDPTIATVTDPDKLKEQPFFAQAKKGDKIFIFTTAKKAYLYNPELSKIVEIAPINIGSTPPATPPPANPKK